MAVRLQVSTSGRFSLFLDRAVIRPAKADVTAGVRAATRGLTTDLRQMMHAAGLGDRFPNAVRGKAYPERGESFAAAGEIGIRDPKAAAIVEAFARGVVIRPKGRRWLAIPTPAAGPQAAKRGGKRLTPDLWEQRTGIRLRFVPPGNGRRTGLLVAGNARLTGRGRAARIGRLQRGQQFPSRAGASVVIFILVKLTRLTRRLDPERVAAEWAGRIPDLIARATGRAV